MVDESRGEVKMNYEEITPLHKKLKELQSIAQKKEYFREFIDKFVDFFSPIFYRGQYYLYENGCYFLVEEDHIKSLIYKGLDNVKFRKTNDIVNNMKLKCFVEDRKVIKQNLSLNFRNGLLNLGSLKLEPHSKEHISFNQFPFEYDPNAQCPEFNKFLTQIFTDEPEKSKALQEYSGYTLEPDNRFEKAAILFGPGANGKGTFAKVMQTILGTGNYSCIPLEKLGGRFQTQMLLNKMANFSSEIPKQMFVHDARLKEVISGDEIQGEYKNGAIFFFTPYAKLFILANHLPKTADSSYAFWRKIMVIPFNISFKEDDRDLNLINKLLNELPGIFNWMLEGRKRLIERGYFIETPQMKEALSRMKKENDSVVTFVENYCVISSNKRVSKAEIYERYEEFCKNSEVFKRQKEAKIMFGKSLVEKFPAVIDSKRSGDLRYWTGIDLEK